ncbi:MAG: amino acid--tRNA ligase-related protein, partial [Parachlamydiaceae bacterium]
MKRVLSGELKQHAGKQVEVRGWLNNLRAKGKINFLIVRDRAGLIQVIVQAPEVLAKISSLQPGSILRIRGTVALAENASLGAELIDPEIDVEVPIHEVPAIEYYKPEIPSDLEHILDHRPIALRNRKLQAVFKIQAELVHAYRLFMHDQAGAVEYFAPNILGASSEGGAEFFNVDYFGYPATLAQSSQLYKQIMVGVNERVFALMPFFRAEPSHTPRHLSEGKQFEFEMGFFEDWREVMDLQEACLKFMLRYLHEKCREEIEQLGGTIVAAPEDVPFPRITFQEAQELFFQLTGIDERQ